MRYSLILFFEIACGAGGRQYNKAVVYTIRGTRGCACVDFSHLYFCSHFVKRYVYDTRSVGLPGASTSNVTRVRPLTFPIPYTYTFTPRYHVARK